MVGVRATVKRSWGQGYGEEEGKGLVKSAFSSGDL
jgi:hypothetical protein